MKILGINFSLGSSDTDATLQESIAKELSSARPTQNEVEPSAEIPARLTIEPEIRELFNLYPGLESLWKACLMMRVHRYIYDSLCFQNENVDYAEYRRYRKFYQTYMLEVEKPVLDEYLKMSSMITTDFNSVVWFKGVARDYNDRAMLDSILVHAKRLFTEPKFANDLLDLKDDIEEYKEEMDKRDLFITQMKLAATKGSRDEKQVVLEKLRNLYDWRPRREDELAMCKSFIHTYKPTGRNTFQNNNLWEIEFAWGKMIALVARWEGEEQASALADQMEKRTDIYDRKDGDNVRKEMREIRATIRQIGVRKEEYNSKVSLDYFLELLSDFSNAVHFSERFPEADEILNKG